MGPMTGGARGWCNPAGPTGAGYGAWGGPMGYGYPMGGYGYPMGGYGYPGWRAPYGYGMGMAWGRGRAPFGYGRGMAWGRGGGFGRGMGRGRGMGYGGWW